MEVQSFALSAKALAQGIMAKDLKEAEGYSHSCCMPYMHPTPLFYSPYMHSGPSYHTSSSSDRNDNSGLILVGGAALVAGLVTIYNIGSDWGLKRNVESELEDLKERKEFCMLDAQASGNTQKIDILYNKQEKILKMVQSDVSWGLYTKGAFLLSAATVLTGAIAASSALMIGGGAAAATSLGVILFRSGFNQTSNLIKREAQSLYEMSDAVENNRFKISA